MKFKLDPRLETDSSYICTIGLCQIRMSNDSRYPWLILIPELADLTEIDDLSLFQQVEVLKISNILSKALKTCFKPDKLNTACLGNIVKQLHIHHVARFEYDDAWPGPIWGQGKSIPYCDESRATRLSLILDAINIIKKEM